jgi:hypothetical protein
MEVLKRNLKSNYIFHIHTNLSQFNRSLKAPSKFSIYQIPCSCKQTYVGQTKSALKTVRNNIQKLSMITPMMTIQQSLNIFKLVNFNVSLTQIMHLLLTEKKITGNDVPKKQFIQ